VTAWARFSVAVGLLRQKGAGSRGMLRLRSHERTLGGRYLYTGRTGNSSSRRSTDLMIGD